MKKNNKYGFTLIELLVTITIIGIISVMALPQISKMQSSNIQRKCEVFKSSFLSAGKVYNSSYEEDLFGDIPSGCVEVPFKDVQGKKLIKDIQINNGTCNPNDASLIRIRKANDKYRYEVFMRCTQNNQEIFATDNFPPTAGCTLTVEGDTSPPTITPFIKFKGSNVSSSTTYTVEDKNEVKASVTLNDSGSGMAATNKISYIWKIGASIKSSGTETKNTTAGAGSVSINIPVPDTIATQSGTYILEVTPADVKDAVGNILGNANKKTKTIKVYIDTTAPTIATDITYNNKSVDSSKTYTIKNKNDVKAYVTLQDNKYGLANSNKVNVKWTRNGSNISNKIITIHTSGYPKTKKEQITVPTEIAKHAGTYKLEITAADVKNKKGNKTPTSTKVHKTIKVKMKSSSTTPTPTPTTTTTPKQCIPTTPTVSMKAGKNTYKNNTWVGSNVAVSASSDACTTKYEYYNTSTKKTGTGASFTAKNGVTKFKYRACSSDGCSGYTSEYTVKVDTAAPTCGKKSGGSTTWSKAKSRSVGVGCSDGGSGCESSSFTTSVTKECKTSDVSITIKDKVGNTATCKNNYNIYLDRTAPEVVKYKTKVKSGWTHFYIYFKDTAGLNTVNKAHKTDGKMYYCYNGKPGKCLNICKTTSKTKIGKKYYDTAKIDSNLQSKSTDTVEIKTSNGCAGTSKYTVYIVVYACDLLNNCAWRAKTSPFALNADQGKKWKNL